MPSGEHGFVYWHLVVILIVLCGFSVILIKCDLIRCDCELQLKGTHRCRFLSKRVVSDITCLCFERFPT